MDSEDNDNSEYYPIIGATKSAPGEYVSVCTFSFFFLNKISIEISYLLYLVTFILQEYAGQWKRQRRELTPKGDNNFEEYKRKNSDKSIDNIEIDRNFALNVPSESITSSYPSSKETDLEHKIVSFRDLSGNIESFGTSISIIGKFSFLCGILIF